MKHNPAKEHVNIVNSCYRFVRLNCRQTQEMSSFAGLQCTTCQISINFNDEDPAAEDECLLKIKMKDSSPYEA